MWETVGAASYTTGDLRSRVGFTELLRVFRLEGMGAFLEAADFFGTAGDIMGFTGGLSSAGAPHSLERA